MKILNRSAIAISYKKPFIDWHDSLMPGMPLDENIQARFATYLVTEFLGVADEVLRKHYKSIFENELFGMWADENDWPQNRTYKLFNEWFSVVVAGYVFDLPKTRIESIEV